MAVPDVRVAARLSLKKARHTSTEQIAERFCDEMIQNLKRNVTENEQRFAVETSLLNRQCTLQKL